MTGKWRMWRETNDCCETGADANQYQASRYQPLNAEHTPTYHISSRENTINSLTHSFLLFFPFLVTGLAQLASHAAQLTRQKTGTKMAKKVP